MSKVKTVMRERKNLNIEGKTYERLKKFGQFGESFDDLINRVLDIIEKGNYKK